METTPPQTDKAEGRVKRRPPEPRRATSTERDFLERDDDLAVNRENASLVSSGVGSLLLLAAVLVVLMLAREPASPLFTASTVQTWATVFVSLVIQAMPFLVLGVVISATITVFVPVRVFEKILPKKPAAAVGVAGAAGLLLPGCECGSVPIGAGLIRRGIAPAAALTFLLAAPAINPVVLVATAVAFPGAPEMVVARAVASIIAAVSLGWLWLALGKREWIRIPTRPMVEGSTRMATFFATIRHDFITAGGMLVVGGVVAGFLKVLVPAEWLSAVADNPVLSILVLALLAVVLSLCSEADAFVAASLSQFSMTSRLAFLVVGPMIDIKLFAMQIGVFGRRFAFRFAPATFVVALGSAALVGWVVL